MSIEEAVENIKLLTNRLSILETKINNITPVDRTEAQAQPSGENGSPPMQEDPLSLSATAEEEVQGSTIHKVSSQDIERIKESLSKISLPQELKLNDSAAGIKQDSKNVLKVLSKVGRYTETTLKQVSVIAARNKIDNCFNVPEYELANLFTLASGLMQFIQAEYAALVVKNTFNEETSRLFRSFENHASAFNSASLQNLRIAADLAASANATARDRGSRGRGNRGYNNNNWNRGRGSYHRGRGFNAEWSNARNPPTSRPNDLNE